MHFFAPSASLGDEEATSVSAVQTAPIGTPAVAARTPDGRIVVVGSAANGGSLELVESWRRLGLDAELVPGSAVLAAHRPRDRVIGRLDVLPTLDGVEAGLLALVLLERRGADLVNTAGALLRTHDKLRTARILTRVGLPHPVTTAVRTIDAARTIALPFVLKPRFGSWGGDVYRCDSPAALAACLEEVAGRPWFRRHGALVQELIPPPGFDLRVLVAGGQVVGAIERVAAEGEWRTNVSLGGQRRACRLPDHAAELARTAAVVAGADLVGVDLLPLASGGYRVLELNGAVDFDHDYSLKCCDVFEATAAALELL
jgi:[lysine-biosynthesis-protein LysW]--L-2-aminoadipate ligase